MSPVSSYAARPGSWTPPRTGSSRWAIRRSRSARSARGQHFLRSSRLAAALVRDAGIAPDEVVIDVGAGTGVLTLVLLEAGARVVAVERDASLAAGLRARFGGRVSIVQSDV